MKVSHDEERVVQLDIDASVRWEQERESGRKKDRRWQGNDVRGDYGGAGHVLGLANK